MPAVLPTERPSARPRFRIIARESSRAERGAFVDSVEGTKAEGLNRDLERLLQETTERVGLLASDFLQRQALSSSKCVRTRKGELVALNKQLSSDTRERQLEELTTVEHSRKREREVSVAMGEIVLSAGSMIVAATSLIAGAGLHWVGLAMIAFCGRKTFRRAFERVISGRKPDMDVLNSVIITGFIFSGQLVLATVPLLLTAVRQKLVHRIKHESRKAILGVYDHQPRRVRAQLRGETVEVDVTELFEGQRVIVSAGETIPVDGKVIAGYASVDQHLLTGEFLPVERSEGDPVYALTVLLTGQLIIAVTETGGSTAAARIAETLNKTIEYKTNAQVRAEQKSEELITPAFALGILASPVIGLSGGLGILNAPPVHNMSISSAICMLSYLNLSSKMGILIKDGRTLDFLSQIDTVLFDKTGTLTEPVPTIAAVHTVGCAVEEEVISLAAALESGQDHPIAQAIVDRADELLLPTPKVVGRECRIGFGVAGRVNDEDVVLGSKRFMDLKGIPIAESLTEVEQSANALGHSWVILAKGGSIAGVIELAPCVRSGVSEVIDVLKSKFGKRVCIVSGDQERPTHHLAERVGIDHVFAEVLPERKGEIVRQLQQEGRKVCFVGDGINDSIALKAANVSISIKGAAGIATDVAQVILMDGRMSRLKKLFELSQGYQRQMRATSKLVLAPPVLGIFGVLFMHFGFLAVVGLNQLGFVTSIANSLTPTRGLAAGERKRLLEIRSAELNSESPDENEG